MVWQLKSVRECHFQRAKGEIVEPCIALCFSNDNGEEFYLWAARGKPGFHVEYLPSELHPDLDTVPTLREYH